jgi:transposase
LPVANIPAIGKDMNKRTIEKLYYLYGKGVVMRRIGEIIGVSRTTVMYWLGKKNKIPSYVPKKNNYGRDYRFKQDCLEIIDNINYEDNPFILARILRNAFIEKTGYRPEDV